MGVVLACWRARSSLLSIRICLAIYPTDLRVLTVGRLFFAFPIRDQVDKRITHVSVTECGWLTPGPNRSIHSTTSITRYLGLLCEEGRLLSIVLLSLDRQGWVATPGGFATPPRPFFTRTIDGHVVERLEHSQSMVFMVNIIGFV